MAAAGYAPAVAPGMAAGAAVPGLNALILPLLAAFGPAIFSKLFNKGQDTQKQIEELLKPETLAKLREEFYRQALQSPAYSQAQGTIAAGANQTANNVAASLAARGVGTTGSGAILSGLTPSLVGSQTAKLRTDAYGVANESALANLKERLAALTNKQPSQSQQMLGAGLESFGPYLTQFLKARYPGTFGNLTVPGGGTSVQ